MLRNQLKIFWKQSINEKESKNLQNLQKNNPIFIFSKEQALMWMKMIAKFRLILTKSLNRRRNQDEFFLFHVKYSCFIGINWQKVNFFSFKRVNKLYKRWGIRDKKQYGENWDWYRKGFFRKIIENIRTHCITQKKAKKKKVHYIYQIY